MTRDVYWYPGLTLEDMEEQIIKKALAFYEGNKSATAHSLGIAIRTLDHKLQQYRERAPAPKYGEGLPKQKELSA